MTEQQEKEYYKMLGERFKALRKRAGKTAEEIAAEIAVYRAEKKRWRYLLTLPSVECQERLEQ